MVAKYTSRWGFYRVTAMLCGVFRGIDIDWCARW